MIINPKLIVEIVIGISGVIGLGVLCRKTSQGKKTESSVSENLNDETISFGDSFVSENSAQAEADFVNAINTIRLNELFAKLNEIDYRKKMPQRKLLNSRKKSSKSYPAIVAVKQECMVLLVRAVRYILPM